MDDVALVSDKKKFRIYRARDAQNVADEVMPILDDVEPQDTAGLTGMIDEGLLEGGQAMVLYEDVAAGISLVHNWFKPHYPLPVHSHNADCLYYIVSGSARMGKDVLKAGDGFFVPADSPYHYDVGAEGVEMLEFRTAARFNVKYKTAEAMWKKLIARTAAARAGWQTSEAPPAVKRMAGHD